MLLILELAALAAVGFEVARLGLRQREDLTVLASRQLLTNPDSTHQVLAASIHVGNWPPTLPWNPDHAAGFEHAAGGPPRLELLLERRRPPSRRGAAQVASVGSTAMSNWAFATSVPTGTSVCAAIGCLPAALAARLTLQIRARVADAPGTCSGSAPASGPGRPCSLTVSHDQVEIGVSRPLHLHAGESKVRGTYKE